MEPRPTTHGSHGLWRPLIAGIVTLTLMITLGIISASAAAPTRCRVTNTVSATSYKALQAAVDAARAADRLTVTGTCTGGTIIDRDLVIEGTKMRGRARPILDGGTRERVLRVRNGVTVTMRWLVIQRGRARNGGGIMNRGNLTLRDVVVSGNRAASSVKWAGQGVSGGGVVNLGTLSLAGRSMIRDNTVVGRLHFPSFTPPNGGGVVNAGTLTLDDRSAIKGNTILGHCIQGFGGGVSSDGDVVMNDRSAISGNRIVFRCATPGIPKYASGGGVDLWGSLTLNGASRISHNRIVARVGRGEVRPFGHGGGVYKDREGSLTLNDHSTISHNHARVAGGIDAGGDYSSLTMTGSSAIVGNVAEKLGGGILYHRPSLFSGVTCAPGPSANVRRNRPDDCYLKVWKP